ncbi:hypothetical protein HIM_10065 [Hirsutella minnesotensis 3608]|uniref:RNase H type-1 domain-containing protein n=1 Tax=Hirsutella minnesotensis 3608 TaxID=1043627 RepID=A0A0F7ZG99_9HYPO|nr:hypothetical protein HIM_10065 [Hirsutella minnesotensis 3608]
MDYASNVWSHACGAKEASWIDRARRVGAQAVTGGFRTVATGYSSGRGGGRRVIISRTARPSSNEILDKDADAPEDASSDIVETQAEQERREVIHEFALAPWIERLQMVGEYDQVELAKPGELEGIVIATSSSQRKGLVGMGGVVRDASRNSPGEAQASYSDTVGPSDEQNAYTAGLAAIAMTLQCLPADLRCGGMTIVTSNLSVLQVLARP